MNQLPSLLRGSRRAPMARLVGIGLAQGAGAFAALHLIVMLDAAPAPRMPLLALTCVALLLGLLHFCEVVEAERLGQAYARALRRRLLERLFLAGAGSLSRFSRGGLWLRLTSDLNGLRQWISLGVARLACALPMLLALLLSLSVTQPRLALLAWSALGLLGLMGWALRRPLRERERVLRRARGRLAAQVDRSLSQLAAAMDAELREQRLARLRRSSRAIAHASVARSRLHGALRGSVSFAVLALTAGVMALAFNGAAVERAEFLSALALLGLLGAPLRDLARAYEMRQGFVVAGANLRRVLALEPTSAAAMLPHPRLPDAVPVDPIQPTTPGG